MGSPSVLVALCMTLTLAWLSAAQTWDTEYDQFFQYSCPTNQFMRSVESQHNNLKEDRVWKFQCLKLGKKIKAQNCAWTDFINEYDQPMFFSCPPNKAMAGIEGTNDDYYKDRRFKVKCCGVKGRVLHTCQLTGFQNAMDGLLDFQAPTKAVMTGMYSYHTDNTEDRRYRFTYCRACAAKRCK